MLGASERNAKPTTDELSHPSGSCLATNLSHIYELVKGFLCHKGLVLFIDLFTK